MHQSLQGATFHMEHVVPRARGGPTILANLAWACPTCNFRKSDRKEVVDQVSGNSVPLYNPRKESWHDHFEWHDYHVHGLTPIGRATVIALDLNHPRRVLIRQAEEKFGLFPPEADA